MEFEKARSLMIKNQLIPNKINNESIINAFKLIKKEVFLPEDLQNLAYIDNEIFLDENNSYLSNLHIAQLIQSANFLKTDSVLHIGAMTGYVTTLISKFVKNVTAIEENVELYNLLCKNINLCQNTNIKTININYNKINELKPNYDVIFIDNIVEIIPNYLLEKLNNLNGRLLSIKRINNNLNKGIKITSNNQKIISEIIFDCFSEKQSIIKENIKFRF